MKSLLIAGLALVNTAVFAGQVQSHSGYCSKESLANETCGATTLKEALATAKENAGSCYVKPVFGEGQGNRPVGYVCQVIND